MNMQEFLNEQVMIVIESYDVQALMQIRIGNAYVRKDSSGIKDLTQGIALCVSYKICTRLDLLA